MNPSHSSRADAVPCAVFRHCILMFALLSTVARSPSAQAQARAGRVVGCWQLSRPLGPTGGALIVPRDAAWTVVALRDSGRVVLPLVNERERTLWEQRSYWSHNNDSLDLTVFTGLQGWRARLTTRTLPSSMSGVAEYLSDAIASNPEQMRAAVTLTRMRCGAKWSALPVTTRLPRSWERGTPLYFDFQVERPAALASGVVLPVGVRAMRSLRRDEELKVEPEVVVAQFVVDVTGRADTTSLKLLSPDHASAAVSVKREVAMWISRVRFTAPMVGGRAVNQLAQWRLERSRN